MSHLTATSTAVFTAAHAAITPHENMSVRSCSRGSINRGGMQHRRRTSSIVRHAASSVRVVVNSLSPSVTVDDVADAAAEWLKLDTNPSTRDEIQAMLDAGDSSTLADRLLTKRLEFGTAGLRGEMGAGYDRMNNLVVLQTTQGLCDYVMAQLGDDQAKTRGVVLGFDGRHNSRQFAHTAARVLMSRGVKVFLFADLIPTPLVAFGVAHLNAAAGVCVTASHNPKQYNGYKVYWGNGCQIIPPHDAGIAAAIDANLKPWSELQQVSEDSVANFTHPLISDPTETVANAYFATVKAALCNYGADSQCAGSKPVAYTPLHGVGAPYVERMFNEFNLPAFIPVASQMKPDPEFSTVVFPNPEEGRATWFESFAAATAAGATICVANDPDADRLAAAEMTPGGSSEEDWRSFSGNEIGALLAHWTWTQWKARNPGRDPSSAAMLASAVSSKMLAAMAAKEGFVFRETLTGFKWLGNVAKDLEAEGLEVIFAFEEAIGFMFGAVHKDKDGVAAAAVFAEMAARIASQHGGRTVAQHLDWLYGEYGYHAGRASYFIADTPDASKAVFERLRGGYPKSVGPLAVESVRDLGTGEDSGTADGQPTLPWTPGDMMITFRLAGGAELTLRASGTEPKLKYYLEVRAEDRDEAEATAEAVAAAVWSDLVSATPGLNPSV